MNARRAGSALILALWSLFFLSAIAVAVASQVSSVLRLAWQLRNGVVARSLAVAGVETAVSDVVSGAPDVTNNPARFRESSVFDAGVFSVSYVVEQGGLLVTNYGLVAESTKVNINKASTLEITELFRSRGGLDGDSAAAVANCIVDWRDADSMPLTGGAEGRYYESLSMPYKCHDADMTVVEELLLVKGVTPELFLRIRPFVTVADGACFGGTASGYAIGGGRTTAVERIEFVVDQDGRTLSWYEE